MAAEPSGKMQLDVSVSEWLSISDSWWGISGNVSSVLPNHSWGSRLDFNNSDSNITVIGGKLRFDKRLAIKASYGAGDINKGSVRDRDWITVPGLNDYNRLVSESIEDGGGDTSIFEIGADILLTGLDSSSNIYLYLGYFFYEDYINITNGIQTVSDNTYFDASDTYWSNWGFNPVGSSYPALSSTYKFSWEFLKLGVNVQFEKERFAFEAGGNYLYLSSYKGDGFWNLRPLNFVHESDNGYGFDGSLKVSYRVYGSAWLSLGYRYFKLKAEDGLDTTYFSDGSVATALFDDAESERKGPVLYFDWSF